MWFFVVLLVSALDLANTIKVWVPSTSLDNPDNFAKFPLSPCDHLKLDKANGVNVLVPSTSVFNIESIDLPRDGLLTFPSSSKILFGDPEGCANGKGKDVEFLRDTVKGWLDPGNWMDTSPAYKWLPDREKVPCAGEPIVFSPRQSHSVILPSILLPISTVTIENQALDADGWSTYLESEEGYETFQGATDLRGMLWRSRAACSHDLICPCAVNPYTIRDWTYHEVTPQVFDESICLYAKRKCEPPPCHSPIQPEGHCCPICGAVLRLKGGFKTKAQINSFIESSNIYGYDLNYYAGATSDGCLQIVLISSNGELDEALTMAELLSTRLKSVFHGSQPVSMTYSGSSNKFSKMSSVFGIWGGTFAAMIFILASIYIIYMVLPKQKWVKLTKSSPFGFVRFKNTLHEAVSEETLVLGTEPQPPAVESFSNPLYNADKIVSKEKTQDLADDSPDLGGSVNAEESQSLVSVSDGEQNNDDGDIPMASGLANPVLFEDEDLPADDSDHEGSIVSFSQLRTLPLKNSDDE